MHDYAIAGQSYSYLGRKYEIAARLSHQVKVVQGKSLSALGVSTYYVAHIKRGGG